MKKHVCAQAPVPGCECESVIPLPLSGAVRCRRCGRVMFKDVRQLDEKPKRRSLRSLQDVINEMEKLFGHGGIDGVYGFLVNVKTAKSRLQLRWGDVRSPLKSKK